MVNYKSRRVIAVVAALLFISIASIIAVTAGNDNQGKSVTTKPSSPSTGYNLSPATEQEKTETQQHKDSLNKPPEQSTNASGQKKQVSVIITSATTDNINAYVSGVLEDGGTCTATLTKNNTTITKTASAFSNVSTTSCTPIKPEFPTSGIWTVRVNYSSAFAEGNSQTTVEVN